MHSTQAPLVRDLFRAVADGHDRAEVTQLQQQVHNEKRDLERKLEMAHAWFSKHGGFGDTEPDPLPPQWQERTDKWQQWLWDYQVLQCSQFLTTAMLLEGDG